MIVKAKKHLGQHFLKDMDVSKRIADTYGFHNDCYRVLELGAGTGALTKFLLDKEKNLKIKIIDIDPESIKYIKNKYRELEGEILEGDFLSLDLVKVMGKDSFSVVGNFPYNISTQILFKCLEMRDQIPEIMGMFQREVALRIAEPPGSKQRGILSVLMQAYYDVEYCFTVNEDVFYPPPKVKSGVIRLTRNKNHKLPCNEKLFKNLVKASFNQRRKTIRNSLKTFLRDKSIDSELLSLRPEALSVKQFIDLTVLIESKLNIN